ncbi:MAG: protein-L-isoaspartate(D-aspartate) O-methyltransferase [Marinilabiliaceae bacterium]|nr:protein-L-isoaspartate(D-aspartate) O-methyltransferase [Marinilabiliaceae bacterium]
MIMVMPQNYKEERQHMVSSQIERRGVNDPGVVKAMKSVPRHLFVPYEFRHLAYQDSPLPIGHNQTISQPYIVAYMTEHLHLNKSDKVLEIGTGSGYQAAVLSLLVDSVFTIEIIPELTDMARLALAECGYHNVYCKSGDGYHGWMEHAPYDAIIVTAAPPKVPQPLIEQLAIGGRLIIPVGPQLGTQYLKLFIKKENRLVQKSLLPVRFVPFTREIE